MKNLTQEVINEKRTRLEMRWEEFIGLIESRVCEETGLNKYAAFSLKIIAKQREEGSPSYKTDKYDFYIDVVEKNV